MFIGEAFMQTKTGVAQSVFVLGLLALQDKNKPLKSYTFSKILRVSDSYLKKIIRKLVVAGILTSSASKTGGLSLKRAPEDISFLDVFLAIEGAESFFATGGMMSNFQKFDDHYLIEKGKIAIDVFDQAEKQYKQELAKHRISDLLDEELLSRHFDFSDISLAEAIQGTFFQKLSKEAK